MCVLPLAVIQKKSDQCLDVSAIFAVQSKGCTIYNGVLKVQTCVVEIYNNMLLIADTTRFLTFALKFDILYVLFCFFFNKYLRVLKSIFRTIFQKKIVQTS